MKGSIGCSTSYQDIFFGTPLYNNRHMKNSMSSILNFENSKEAQFRLKVIEFHKKYGTVATIDAFGVSKATIYRWKERLSQAQGRLESLIPFSKAPKRKRVMLTHPKVIEFIKRIREEKPRLGKEKIKPLLDEYCQKENLKTISSSTIGKIIKHYNLYIKSRRIYHNPFHKYSKAKLSYKTKVKRSPKPINYGYIEIDTVVSGLSMELSFIS